MRAGSPSGVPSAPGAGPSIRSGMPASQIIERRRRLRTGPPARLRVEGAVGKGRFRVGGGLRGAQQQKPCSGDEPSLQSASFRLAS
jgi:hypothetical protein